MVCYVSVCNVCMCVCCLCVCVSHFCVHMCMCYICVYMYVYINICVVCVYTCVYVYLCMYVCCLSILSLCVCVSISGTGRRAVVTISPIPGWGWDLSGAIRPPCTALPTPPTPPPDFEPGEFLQTQRGCDRAIVCRHRSVSWQHGPRTEEKTPGNGMKASLHKSTGH